MEHDIAQVGSCLKCGYDLRGLHSCICPECGQAFDPENTDTLAGFRPRFGPIGRWAEGPVWRIVWVLLGINLLAIIWYARYPENVLSESRIFQGLWYFF